MNFEWSAFADEAGESLEEQIAALKANRIPMLEIRGVDGKNVADLTASEAKEIRGRLDEAGITVWSIGSPVGKIRLDEDFNAHRAVFGRLLETAHILGAKHFRLFSFYAPQGKTISEAAWRDAALERLSLLCEDAKGSGVLLCHENEKGIYGATAPHCLELQKALPSMRAVFDPANFIQCGQDTLEAWDLLSPYVEYFHVKDARPDGTVVPTGKGSGHVPQLLAKYAAAGGRVVTLEPHLTVFTGLRGLETPGEASKITDSYPTMRAAFDAGAEALRNCIASLNGEERNGHNG